MVRNRARLVRLLDAAGRAAARRWDSLQCHVAAPALRMALTWMDIHATGWGVWDPDPDPDPRRVLAVIAEGRGSELLALNPPVLDELLAAMADHGYDHLCRSVPLVAVEALLKIGAPLDPAELTPDLFSAAHRAGRGGELPWGPRELLWAVKDKVKVKKWSGTRRSVGGTALFCALFFERLGVRPEGCDTVPQSLPVQLVISGVVALAKIAILTGVHPKRYEKKSTT